MKTDSNGEFRPELYRSYLRVLARVALASGGALLKKLEASDIVQDVLLQAVVTLPQFHGHTEQEFAGWLRTILTHKLTDAARHFNRQKRNAALEQSYRETVEDSAARLGTLIPADLTSPSLRLFRMCANLSWKLKRLQTPWFDGIGRNNIKPVRERSRDEESVTFGKETQEVACAG